MQLNRILSESEKKQLVDFNKNEVLKGAVKKVLLYNIYGSESMEAGETPAQDKHWVYGMPTLDMKVSDEEVGRMVRVKVSALSFLEDAFRELESFNVEIGEQAEEENPAI